MRRRTVRAQLAVVAIVSIVVVTYTLFGLLKLNLGSGPFPVTVRLASAGGIFDGAEVAYRGVKVGRVSSVDLHTGGVTVTLAIDNGTQVPDNAIAHVYDLSAVGEQYVDLEPPRHPSSTYLAAGSVIPRSRSTTPLATATVLYDLERFLDSLHPQDLQVLGRQGALALQGTGPQLKSILADTTSIVNQLSAGEGNLLDLLHNAGILLHGAAAHAGAFDRFTGSLRQLSASLAGHTPIINTFLRQAAPTTRLVNNVIAHNGSALTSLLGNLATLGDIQSARVPGLQALLLAVPEFGRLAPTVVHGDRLIGIADANQSQPVCNTGVPLTNPLSGRRSRLYAVNCGGILRGAENAPRPGSATGTATLRRTALEPSARPAGPGLQVGEYDAATGLVSTDDGALYRLGTTGGQDRLFGPNAWQALLLAVTGS